MPVIRLREPPGDRSPAKVLLLIEIEEPANHGDSVWMADVSGLDENFSRHGAEIPASSGSEGREAAKPTAADSFLQGGKDVPGENGRKRLGKAVDGGEGDWRAGDEGMMQQASHQ